MGGHSHTLVPIVIAGGGFALMAWALAQHRTHISRLGHVLDRPHAELLPHGGAPSREFYRILDKATACFEHRNATFMGGTVTGPYRCAL
jgi:hypothetical protein